MWTQNVRLYLAGLLPAILLAAYVAGDEPKYIQRFIVHPQTVEITGDSGSVSANCIDFSAHAPAPQHIYREFDVPPSGDFSIQKFKNGVLVDTQKWNDNNGIAREWIYFRGTSNPKVEPWRELEACVYTHEPGVSYKIKFDESVIASPEGSPTTKPDLPVVREHLLEMQQPLAELDKLRSELTLFPPASPICQPFNKFQDEVYWGLTELSGDGLLKSLEDQRKQFDDTIKSTKQRGYGFGVFCCGESLTPAQRDFYQAKGYPLQKTLDFSLLQSPELPKLWAFYMARQNWAPEVLAARATVSLLISMFVGEPSWFELGALRAWFDCEDSCQAPRPEQQWDEFAEKNWDMQAVCQEYLRKWGGEELSRVRFSGNITRIDFKNGELTLPERPAERDFIDAFGIRQLLLSSEKRKELTQLIESWQSEDIPLTAASVEHALAVLQAPKVRITAVKNGDVPAHIGDDSFQFNDPKHWPSSLSKAKCVILDIRNLSSLEKKAFFGVQGDIQGNLPSEERKTWYYITEDKSLDRIAGLLNGDLPSFFVDASIQESERKDQGAAYFNALSNLARTVGSNGQISIRVGHGGGAIDEFAKQLKETEEKHVVYFICMPDGDPAPLTNLAEQTLAAKARSVAIFDAKYDIGAASLALRVLSVLPAEDLKGLTPVEQVGLAYKKAADALDAACLQAQSLHLESALDVLRSTFGDIANVELIHDGTFNPEDPKVKNLQRKLEVDPALLRQIGMANTSNDAHDA